MTPKDLSEFSKRSDRPLGVVPACKSCEKIRKAKYLDSKNGKEVTHCYNKKVYVANKDKLLATNKKWREENKERRQKYLLDYEKNRRKRNPADVLRYAKKYLNKRYRNDPKYRLCRIMSTAIKRSLGAQKNGYSWEDLVDYTYEDLLKRLKSTIPEGYSWDDYQSGKTDLEIDHIVPMSVFNFSTPNDLDFKRCWSLGNLQLLPKIDNVKKSNRLSKPFQPCLKLALT